MEKDLLSGWSDVLHSKSKADKRFALKEISRYVFPVRKEIYKPNTQATIYVVPAFNKTLLLDQIKNKVDIDKLK